ncbi:hypothetical protein JOD64_001601 [Micromonospora luteifusca]|uniref:Uncharacterized protein n=1 Tax=Micromonospora luteifusca TaxID=709860 RepID=A0ABS2LQC1_9ACTN|nr:hypothetical protein [Micromonospora luteifusca]
MTLAEPGGRFCRGKPQTGRSPLRGSPPGSCRLQNSTRSASRSQPRIRSVPHRPILSLARRSRHEPGARSRPVCPASPVQRESYADGPEKANQGSSLVWSTATRRSPGAARRHADPTATQATERAAARPRGSTAIGADRSGPGGRCRSDQSRPPGRQRSRQRPIAPSPRRPAPWMPPARRSGGIQGARHPRIGDLVTITPHLNRRTAPSSPTSTAAQATHSPPRRRRRPTAKQATRHLKRGPRRIPCRADHPRPFRRDDRHQIGDTGASRQRDTQSVPTCQSVRHG